MRHTHFLCVFGLYNRKTSSQVRAATPETIVFMHKQYSQAKWNEGEAEGHKHKNAFTDRYGTRFYEEQSLVEQVIRRYCTDNGLTLFD